MRKVREEEGKINRVSNFPIIINKLTVMERDRERGYNMHIILLLLYLKMWISVSVKI